MNILQRITVERILFRLEKDTGLHGHLNEGNNKLLCQYWPINIITPVKYKASLQINPSIVIQVY